ncbi:hypothetical protein PYCCODRAFT_1463103 [Trametes coccinea BRFM310]|uniref:Uncharacterized protein n=1 Tax=Trametes coccinea (strain BRFM310) TaxID=1353009 RepID=A0A1Y2J317_TRAC3|nr:hypothetical protein PYCCODRAFT_1463103 [Trametes coccinea BRFM310]
MSIAIRPPETPYRTAGPSVGRACWGLTSGRCLLLANLHLRLLATLTYPNVSVLISSLYTRGVKMDTTTTLHTSPSRLPLRWRRKLAPELVPDILPSTERAIAAAPSPPVDPTPKSAVEGAPSHSNLPFKWRRKLAPKLTIKLPPAKPAPSPLRRRTRSQTAASMAKTNVLASSEKLNATQTTSTQSEKKKGRKRRGKAARRGVKA